MDQKESETDKIEAAGPALLKSEDLARANRRKILKAGAIGAPLVLTFRSTSAWAVSAGCLVEQGNEQLPELEAVNEDFQPFDPPQTILVNAQVGEPVTMQTSTGDELRALVNNNNIGMTCYTSITNSALNGS